MPELFLAGILWIKKFFSKVIRGSKIFSCENLVGPIYFFVDNFVIQRFSFVGCIGKSERIQRWLQKDISNRAFYCKSILAIVSSVCIKRVLHLLI